MIKHYFCEYCGKDFLSEDECAKHEMECEVRIKKELEEEKEKKEKRRQTDLEEIVYCFSEFAELCADYVEKYGAPDLDKLKSFIQNKLAPLLNKESVTRMDFQPYELSFDDVKYDMDLFHDVCGFGKSPFKTEAIQDDKVSKSNSKDEVDAIIDKLSEPSLFVTHEDKEPEDAVTYYFNGKEVSEKEFAKECAKLLPPSKRKEFEKECGLFYDEEYL